MAKIVSVETWVWTEILGPEAKLSRTFCNSAPSTLAKITV